MKPPIPLWLTLVTCSACMVPRSASFGQTGELLPVGAFETSLTPGLAWRSETTNVPAFGGPVGTAGSPASSNTSAGFTLPQFEGNLAYGISDVISANVHLSPAGVQPGVKLRLLEGPLRIALLPEVALGMINSGSSSTTTLNGVTMSSTGSEPQSLLNMQAGFKLLGRHESGFYGGFGYTFQATSLSTGEYVQGLSTTSSSRYSYSAHQIQLAAGFELVTGMVRLRPELAVLYSPASTYWLLSSSGTTSTAVAGSAFLVFPNITVAIATPAAAAGHSNP